MCGGAFIAGGKHDHAAPVQGGVDRRDDESIRCQVVLIMRLRIARPGRVRSLAIVDDLDPMAAGVIDRRGDLLLGQCGNKVHGAHHQAGLVGHTLHVVRTSSAIQPCRRDTGHMAAVALVILQEAGEIARSGFPRQRIVGSDERTAEFEVIGVHPGIDHPDPDTKAAQPGVVGGQHIDSLIVANACCIKYSEPGTNCAAAGLAAAKTATAISTWRRVAKTKEELSKRE